MAHWDVSDLAYRKEAHFGDRVVNCRVDRPGSVFAMFAASVAQAPGREALVAGVERPEPGVFIRHFRELTALAAG